MTLKILPIGPKCMPRVFPMVKSYIEDALKTTDDCTIDQVEFYLKDGSWELVTAVDEEGEFKGAYVLTIMNSPNDRTAMIILAAGKGLAGQDIFDQLCNYVKGLGATRVQALAKESAARLYGRVGLKEKAILVEKRLWAD